MDNEITKPVSMLMSELTAALAKVVTESGLPPYLVEYILRDLCNEVHAISMKRVQDEKAAYEQSVAEAEKKAKAVEVAQSSTVNNDKIADSKNQNPKFCKQSKNK